MRLGCAREERVAIASTSPFGSQNEDAGTRQRLCSNDEDQNELVRSITHVRDRPRCTTLLQEHEAPAHVDEFALAIRRAPHYGCDIAWENRRQRLECDRPWETRKNCATSSRVGVKE